MVNTSKLSKEERKRLQAILDKTYSEAFARGGLAGGITLGGLASIYPAVYNLYNVNPHFSDEKLEKNQSTGRYSTLALGAGGFGAGYPIGGLIASARLALQKRKARQLLNKESSFKDYAIGGGAGAGIGAGAGMALNFALGRKLLDKRLILGGALVGGGAGTLAGHLKHLQRKQFDAEQATMQDCVLRREDGSIIKKKLRAPAEGEEAIDITKAKDSDFVEAEDGLPLVRPGIYYVKTGDVPIAGLDYVPAAKDNQGHDQIVIISNKPHSSEYYYKGTPRHVRMNRMDNGQWCMTIELAVGTGKQLDIWRNPEGKIIGRHGEEIPDTINVGVVNLNHHWVAPDRMAGTTENDDLNFNSENRAWAGNDIARAMNGDPTNPYYIVQKITDNADYDTPEKLNGAMDSIVTHAMQYEGLLQPWSVYGPKLTKLRQLAGQDTWDNATCMTFAKWVINGLRSEDFLPQQKDSKYFAGYGALAYTPDWYKVGEDAYGKWEPYKVVQQRQILQQPDPILPNPGYTQGYTFIPNTKKKLKKYYNKAKDAVDYLIPDWLTDWKM